MLVNPSDRVDSFPQVIVRVSSSPKQIVVFRPAPDPTSRLVNHEARTTQAADWSRWRPAGLLATDVVIGFDTG